MSLSRDFSSLLSGGLAGGGSGAGIAGGLEKAGVKLNPWQALLLTGGGAAVGALGSFLGSKADEGQDPLEKLQMEIGQQGLKDSKRQYKNAAINDRGMEAFRGYLGAGFRGMRPTSFAEAMV